MSGKTELSRKNPYWLEKHRYYELKHFCLQYPIWKKMRESSNGFSSHNLYLSGPSRNNLPDITSKHAICRSYYSDLIHMIEKTAYETDNELDIYILQGVTEDLSYDKIKARIEIPCCRDTYYRLYRRFFWLLDRARK